MHEMNKRDDSFAHSADLEWSAYGKNIGQLFNTSPENTWVFTGGECVQSDYDQTKGIRNYVGHYEEYIRYDQASQVKIQPDEDYCMQRYMFNTAKKGTRVTDLVDHFDEFVGQYGPKAVAYMLSREDYSQQSEGLETFRQGFDAFVRKSLENGRFFVFQTAYPVHSEQMNQAVLLYNEAALSVLKTLTAHRDNILVVDFYTPNNTDAFKTTALHANGALNATGHFELGKQLSLATIKTCLGYPGKQVTLDLVEESKVATYLPQAAHVIYEQDALQVTMPSALAFDTLRYILTTGNRQIAGLAQGEHFTIALDRDVDYELILQNEQGTQQLKTLYGKTVSHQVATSEANTLVPTITQTRLLEKVKSDKKLTWLFMGDSITHGALWTFGYDGVVQLFEKFLRHDLNRPNDVVLNTAVSGATTQSTLDHLAYRLDKYQADIILLMIGTNDFHRGISVDQYKENLQTLVDKARAKQAVVVLRSPTPTAFGETGKHIHLYVEKMREVARGNPDLIYSEQFDTMGTLVTQYPYLYQPEFSLITDNFPLHPGANGHALMVQYLIDDLGLKTKDSYIYNLRYNMPLTSQKIDVLPDLAWEGDTLSLDLTKFKDALTGATVGEVQLVVKNLVTHRIETVSGTSGILRTGRLDAGSNYEVVVKAYQTDQAIILETEVQEIIYEKD